MKYSEEEKKMWVEAWKQSGKNAWAYAKENGLIPQTFSSWAKKKEKPKSRLGFVEVRRQATPKQSHTPRMMIEKEGMKIYLPIGVNSEELCKVIKSLKGTL